MFLMAVSLTLLLVGCGGREDTSGATSEVPPEPLTTGEGGGSPFGEATSVEESEETVVDETQVESRTGEPFELNTTQPVPPDLRSAYQRRAVILVEFSKPAADFTEGERVDYPQGLSVDTSVGSALESLRPRYPGVEFFTYDIGRPGAARESEGLRRDEYGSLAAQLNVGFTPFVALLTPRPEGYRIENLWQGYVDEGTVEQALFQVAEGGGETVGAAASEFAVTLAEVQLTGSGGGLEFFAVANESDEELDLEGWSLRMVDPESGRADEGSPGVRVSDSVPVAPGESLSVGRAPGAGGGEGSVSGLFRGGQRLDLEPGDEVALLDTSGAVAATYLI